MMGVGTLLVVCVDSHGGLINLTPGGKKRAKKMGGGMARPMYKGGGICKKGKGRAYGKNS